MTGEPPLLAPAPDVQETTQQTTLVQQSGSGPTQPWLTRHLTAVIVLALLFVVCYLAWEGVGEARTAVVVTFGNVMSFVLGSRTALKVPGRDT